MTKRTEKDTNPFAMNGMAPFDGLEMFNGKLAECYRRAGQTFVMNAVKANQEMLRFVSERFQADAEAMQALSRCKDWTELAGCQSQFAQSAAAAYQSEVSALTKLSTDAATETLKPLKEAMETLSKGQ